MPKSYTPEQAVSAIERIDPGAADVIKAALDPVKPLIEYYNTISSPPEDLPPDTDIYPETMEDFSNTEIKQYLKAQYQEVNRVLALNDLHTLTSPTGQAMPTEAEVLQNLSPDKLAKIKRLKQPRLLITPRFATLQNLKQKLDQRLSHYGIQEATHLDAATYTDVTYLDPNQEWEVTVVDGLKEMPPDHIYDGQGLKTWRQQVTADQEKHQAAGTRGIQDREHMLLNLLQLEDGTDTRFDVNTFTALTGQNSSHRGKILCASWNVRPRLGWIFFDDLLDNLRSRGSVRVL